MLLGCEMDLINVSNSSFISIEPDRTTSLLKILISITVPAVIASFITYFSAKKSAENALKISAKMDEKKNKRQIYSQLSGQKHLVSQFYILYFVSLIRSYYTSTLIKYIEKSPNVKFSDDMREKIAYITKENQRSSVKAEELSIEVAKANETLWTTIGMINILFNNNDVYKRIKNIEEFSKIFETFGDNLKEEFENGIIINRGQLNNTKFTLTSKWPDAKEEELRGYLSNYLIYFNDLMDALKNEIEKDEK